MCTRFDQCLAHSKLVQALITVIIITDIGSTNIGQLFQSVGTLYVCFFNPIAKYLQSIFEGFCSHLGRTIAFLLISINSEFSGGDAHRSNILYYHVVKTILASVQCTEEEGPGKG